MTDEKTHWHVGWPVDEAEALERVKRGLPVYWPGDPKPICQTPYIEFSEKRGPNSE